MLNFTNVGLEISGRLLFSGLDAAIAPGAVVGIVGANGAGKSLLLETIAAQLGKTSNTAAQLSGTITANRALTAAFFRQEITPASKHETIAEFVARACGLGVVEAQRLALEQALATNAGDAVQLAAYGEVLETWLALGGADFSARMEQVRQELVLPELDRTVASLSGGEQARVGLAAIALAALDVLLLDEPTNHLDLAGIEYLQAFLQCQQRDTIIFLVSHDRQLLEQVTTAIIEIDQEERVAHYYPTGYAHFLVLKEQAVAQQWAEYRGFAAQRDALKTRIQQSRENLDRAVGKAARTATERTELDKFIRHHQVVKAEKAAGSGAKAKKALARLAEREAPRKKRQLQLHFQQAERSGNKVAGCADVTIWQGERVLVTGANGAGKSSWLRRLCQDANLGAGVKFGVLDQQRTLLAGQKSALAVAADLSLDLAVVQSLLGGFGVTGELAATPGQELSPGQRTRALLVLLSGLQCNTLVLDEPTNHLDLAAISVFEKALKAFAGTVILVTHDRHLAREFAPTRTLIITEGRVSES